MRKLIAFAVLAALMASCADDNPPARPEESRLISPKLRMNVATSSGQSPFTGILTIMPCKPGTSIYFGNYVNQKLTPFYGYYNVKDGTFYNEANNREISLPAGTYNMIYWGTPKYTDPIYANPIVNEPAYVIGGDMAKQKFSLLKMKADTTYYPAFDLVYAVNSANIGSEELQASLQRMVAGLKVTVQNKDNSVLNPSIDSLVVSVTNIANELNFYTGVPQGNPCTVSFPLVLSADGTQMSNGTVMLFPSFGKPEFQMTIMLKNGTVKKFRQTLAAPMVANTKLTLNLTLGDIFSDESSGDFTMENWNEQNEEINVPVLD